MEEHKNDVFKIVSESAKNSSSSSRVTAAWPVGSGSVSESSKSSFGSSASMSAQAKINMIMKKDIYNPNFEPIKEAKYEETPERIGEKSSCSSKSSCLILGSQDREENMSESSEQSG